MPNEKRQSSRFQVDLPVSFRKMSDRKWDGRIQNMSSGGAFLIAKTPPKVGEFVQLNCGQSMQLVGTVVYVVDFPTKLWGFAVRFLQPHQTKNGGNTRKDQKGSFTVRAEGLHQEAFDYYSNLGKVREFVLDNFTEDVSLERVAGVAAQEKTYFSRFFHEKVGITYREWLQYIRIQRAIELMKSSDQSITEAAHAVGFSDLRTFERTFKKWTSMVPRDFKKLVAPG